MKKAPGKCLGLFLWVNMSAVRQRYGTVVKPKTLPVVVPAVFFESMRQKYCVLFTRPAGVKFVPGWLPWNLSPPDRATPS